MYVTVGPYRITIVYSLLNYDPRPGVKNENTTRSQVTLSLTLQQ